MRRVHWSLSSVQAEIKPACGTKEWGSIGLGFSPYSMRIVTCKSCKRIAEQEFLKQKEKHPLLVVRRNSLRQYLQEVTITEKEKELAITKPVRICQKPKRC